MLYRAGNFQRGQSLTWIDRSGQRIGSVIKPRRLNYATLSPDEKRVAYSVRSSFAVTDIWMHDLESGLSERFTFGKGHSEDAVWCPDSSYLVFLNRLDNGTFDFYKRQANGSGNVELLLHGGINATPYDISSDGKLLVYSETRAQSKEDLWLLPLQGEHKPQPYLDSPSNETFGQFSPDGKWMANVSEESGQSQVYVQSIPATGEKHQISTAGGSRPRWRRDGKELFYTDSGTLMSVSVIPGGSIFAFEKAKSVAVFLTGGAPRLGGARSFGFQPSNDGKKFLVSLQEEQDAAPRTFPLTVWMNWQTSLRK